MIAGRLGAAALVAVLGLLALPGLLIGWLVLAGLSGGSSLVLALALIGERARSAAEAGRLSGMSQSVGYLLAAAGPWGAGVLYGVTGSWSHPLLAVTAVGFVTDRAERALAIEANRLLGGDAVVRGDALIEGAIRDAAAAPGLESVDTVELDSMIRVGAGDAATLQLGDVRALGDGFPLRGSFRIAGADGVERDADAVEADRRSEKFTEAYLALHYAAASR